MSTWTNRLRRLALAAALTTAIIPSANAATIVNQGFETGDLTGWSSQGVTGVASSFFDGLGNTIVAAEGNYFAFATAGPEDVYSTLTQSFFANAGEVIKGSVQFVGNDYLPFDDDAFLNVSATGPKNLIFTDTLFSSNIAAVGDYGSTGWVSYSFIAPFSGTFTFQAGVENINDNVLSSSILLDVAAVPEPATWAMMMLGLAGIGATLRQRRRQGVAVPALVIA